MAKADGERRYIWWIRIMEEQKVWMGMNVNKTALNFGECSRM